LQGNGRGKHLWCYRAVVVRRLLALVCHHPHARWIRHREDARDGECNLVRGARRPTNPDRPRAGSSSPSCS
jgi:hypothetical protein